MNKLSIKLSCNTCKNTGSGNTSTTQVKPNSVKSVKEQVAELTEFKETLENSLEPVYDLSGKITHYMIKNKTEGN